MKRSIYFAILFIPVMVWDAASLAQDVYTRLVPTKAQLEKSEELHYGLYVESNKIGWMRYLQRTGEHGDQQAYFKEIEIQLRMATLGEEIEMKYQELNVFDTKPPYSLICYNSRESTDEDTSLVGIRRKADKFVITIEEGGTKRHKEVPAVDFTISDMLTVELWLQEPRQVGDRIKIRSLDAESYGPDSETYEVTAIKSSLVDGVKMTYYECNCSSESEGNVGLFRYDSSGREISGVIGGFVEMRLEPEEVAKNQDAVFDLFVNGMFSSDKPIGEPSDIQELVLKISGKNCRKIVNGPYQTANYDPKTGTTLLQIGKKYDGSNKATEEEIKTSLEDTSSYPVKHPMIKALANEAIGDAKTPHEKVSRLVAFVDAYVVDSYTEFPLTVIDVINRKVGDCSEHSALFTSLARSVGVPARPVSGVIYMGDEVQAFGPHAWNEVVLDGRWIPVDPTWGEVEVNAARIRLEAGDRDIEKMGLALSGGFECELVSIKRKD